MQDIVVTVAGFGVRPHPGRATEYLSTVPRCRLREGQVGRVTIECDISAYKRMWATFAQLDRSSYGLEELCK
jgi:hypothetical protein